MDLLKPGALSREALFAAEQSSNRLVNWFLRVLSYVVIVVGVILLLRRWATVAAGQTPAGVGENVALVLVAPVLAFPLLLLAIGVSWALHRSAVGFVLVGVGLVLLVLLILVIRRRQSGVFAGMFGGGGQSWSKQERDLFRKVALDPDNDDLRLDLAALLERRREPMGEFIRVSQELESCGEGTGRREHLDERWGQLLNQYGRAWYAPLRKLGLEPMIGTQFLPSLWMNHGIIERVLVDRAGILPQKADRLFAAVPGLRVLEFRDSRAVFSGNGWKDISYTIDIAGVVALRHLRQIGELILSSLRLNGEQVRAIASSPNLENLTSLDLGYNAFGPRGAQLLARSTTLGRLRTLNLAGCQLGDEGVVALAGSAHLSRLTSLELRGNAISAAGAAALAGSPHLQDLQTLLLEDNALGPIGAQELVDTEQLRALQTLDLSRNGLGAEPIPSLARSPVLAHMTSLKLNHNNLTGASLRHLAGSPHLGNLEILELDGNGIDAAGILALTGSDTVKQLTALSLAENNLSDAAFKALAKWPGLAHLKKLVLRKNVGGPAGIQALTTSPFLAALEELDLSDNDIGFAGARALVDSPVLNRLKTLTVREAKFTPKAEELLQNHFGERVGI